MVDINIVLSFTDDVFTKFIDNTLLPSFPADIVYVPVKLLHGVLVAELVNVFGDITCVPPMDTFKDCVLK